MALIYAKCVAMLKKAGFGKIVYYMVLCFYAVTPVWGAYSKHALKILSVRPSSSGIL